MKMESADNKNTVEPVKRVHNAEESVDSDDESPGAALLR